MPAEDDDDDMFAQVAALGAIANAARDETLPEGVRDAAQQTVDQGADDLKRRHG